MGLEPRSAKHSRRGDHWLDGVERNWLMDFGSPDIGFLQLCEKFDSIEVWSDPRPNDQLVQRRVTEARWMRDVFDENDAHDALLELGAHSAPPVLLGDPAFDNDDRYFGRSEWKVTLTELGRSVFAREDDMWRHNPIKRWWGGTELTNERLWRWDRESRLLIAP